MKGFKEEGQTYEAGYWNRDIRMEETDSPRVFQLLGREIVHMEEERAYFCSFVIDIILMWFQPQLRKNNWFLSQFPVKGNHFLVHVL